MLTLTLTLLSKAYGQGGEQQWMGTWASAMEFTTATDMPKAPLSNRSLREIIHISVGGDQLRVQLSNIQSTTPVDIKAVYIADATEGSNIVAKTATYLTFGGRRTVTMDAHERCYSDVVSYRLRPLQRLAVTICYGDRTPANATSHRGSRTTSYIMEGVSKPKATFKTTETVDHWYNLASVEVPRVDGTPCIAVLGNSITDGRGSTTNHQDRWTDVLAEQLEGKAAVLNLGIGGNCVIAGGLSEPAAKRFDRDILGQQGVTTLVIFMGTNDIGGSRDGAETAAQLIRHYRAFIRQAHQQGMKVWMGTITPFKNSQYFTPDHELARQMVNLWIRQNQEADGVLDFEPVVCDPADPLALRPDYVSDALHPNAAGYKAMGTYAAQRIKGK